MRLWAFAAWAVGASLGAIVAAGRFERPDVHASAPLREGEPVTVVVRVVDKESGEPVGLADVRIVEDFSRDKRVERLTFADDTGVVRVSTAASWVFAEATATGRVRSAQGSWSRGLDRGPEIVVRLDRGAALVAVVTDARIGAPIAGARVVVVGAGMEGLGSRWTTDGSSPFADVVVGEDGRFEARVPAGQSVYLSATAPGFSDAGDGVRVWPERPTAPIELRLEPAGRVRGVVRDPDGAPSPGARVFFVPANVRELLDLPDGWVNRGGRRWTALVARTDARGRYEIDGLTRGGVYVAFAKSNRWARSERRETVFATDAAPETTADFTLRRFGALRVCVTEADGTRVKAPVELSPGRDTSQDDVRYSSDQQIEDDVTTFERLPPGEYFAAPGWTERSCEGGPTRVDVTEDVAGVLVLRKEPPASIDGVVVVDGGAPLGVTEVCACRPGGRDYETASLDEKGAFRFGHLRATTYELGVTTSGFAHRPLRVAAPASGVRMQLQTCGRLRARFRAARDERPFEREILRVDAQPIGEPIDRVQWGSHSHDAGYWSGDCGPGAWRLRFMIEGRAPVERDVVVKANETIDLGEIVVPCGVDLVGRVVDAEGRPVVGAIVTVGERYELGCEEDATAVDGTFRVTHLPSGRHDVRVEARGFLPETVSAGVGADAEPIVVPLRRGGVVRVEVVHADGSPAPAAVVEFVRGDEAPIAAGATDHRGRTTARLDSGRYRARLRDGGAAEEVQVVADGETTVRLTRR